MKRIKTCLRYPGGKFYGAKHILPLCRTDHKNYIEPFVGGGSIFLGKEPAIKLNWLNDLDSDLINFYKVVQNEKTRQELLQMLRNEEAHKVRHKEILNIEPQNNIEKAFKYFYLNRTSFSGIMKNPRWGYLLGSSVTPDRWKDIINPVSEKLKGAKLTNLDFRKVLNRFKDDTSTLIYLDPPYFKASKSIYKHEFSKQDHLDLVKILKTTKAKFILSYENCPEIRELYNWAKIKEIKFRYYMSEARRQNGNEVIITNF